MANGIRAVHVTTSLELDSGLWYIGKYWITFYNVNSVINIKYLFKSFIQSKLLYYFLKLLLSIWLYHFNYKDIYLKTLCQKTPVSHSRRTKFFSVLGLTFTNPKLVLIILYDIPWFREQMYCYKNAPWHKKNGRCCYLGDIYIYIYRHICLMPNRCKAHRTLLLPEV